MIRPNSLWIVAMVAVLAQVAHTLDKSKFTDPSTLSPENQEYLNAEYEKFMAQRQKDKKAKEAEELRKQQENMVPPPKGISPMELGMKRDPTSSTVALSEHVSLPGGSFKFGTQMSVGDKLVPAKGGLKDGAEPRKQVTVKPFSIDVDCVTNEQFQAFVDATKYQTEAELYTWSFVLDSQVSDAIKAEVDGERGFGRVKNAQHWMAVAGASWSHPYGLDSDINDIPNNPVVHVSFKDANEYCSWAGGLRLPTEKEWEFAARGGKDGQNYPWGNKFIAKNMNIWGGDAFPKDNDLIDGYHGPAPVKSFPANGYGLYNMVGNVWEWVKGGKPDARILRGGSFVDSKDGKYNHAVRVSTRQFNAGDSAATNIGFRCAGDVGGSSSGADSNKMKKTAAASSKRATASSDEADHIEL